MVWKKTSLLNAQKKFFFHGKFTLEDLIQQKICFLESSHSEIWFCIRLSLDCMIDNGLEEDISAKCSAEDWFLVLFGLFDQS